MTAPADPTRAALVAACDAARQAWKKASFVNTPLYYQRYLDACRALYEYDHPAPPAPESPDA